MRQIGCEQFVLSALDEDDASRDAMLAGFFLNPFVGDEKLNRHSSTRDPGACHRRVALAELQSGGRCPLLHRRMAYEEGRPPLAVG